MILPKINIQKGINNRTKCYEIEKNGYFTPMRLTKIITEKEEEININDLLLDLRIVKYEYEKNENEHSKGGKNE